MQKKILVLGGADIQISAIVKAKELGYRVITCDYLPDNPGHKFSDEYHNVSTTDLESVLKLASELEIDGISAYASDPGALTAAFVSEKLGLPGNSYDTVLKLADKYNFRSIQKEIGINYPAFRLVDTPEDILDFSNQFENGIIIKPVDTSGSKGVFHIHKGDPASQEIAFITAALKEAKDYSRKKDIIAEEYIKRDGSLMSGDFLIHDGKVLFQCFGDVHFNTAINGLVPRSISLPASKGSEFLDRVHKDLQHLVASLKIEKGVFNADVIECPDGEPMVIDIGARNGGNMFNDIIFYHSGVNLIELSLLQNCGDDVRFEYDGEILGYYAHNVIHSLETGLLEDIVFSDEIAPLIQYKAINKKRGDKVERFVNSSFRIGLILLKFESFEQMQRILGNIYDHVKVIVKK